MTTLGLGTFEMKTAGGRLALACALATFLIAGTAGAEEGRARVVWLDQGFVLDLPDGWSLEDPGANSGDATGRLRIRLVCGTEACRRTQEACNLYLRSDPVAGPGEDAARLSALYASPIARYTRIRDALTSTSQGATLRGAFAEVQFGGRTWFAVETEAAHSFKSGLFATTVIGGRYLGAICKTCETGEVRHESARALLASVRGAD